MTADLVAIEVPGVVERVEGVMEALSYTKQTVEGVESESVELSLDPAEPLHQPLQGQFHPGSQKVLVRLSRPKGSTGLAAGLRKEDITVIGPVGRMVTFRRMCDLQFPNVDVPESWQGLADAINTLNPEELEHYGALAVDESMAAPANLVVLPPRMASNLDFPVSSTNKDAPLFISRSSAGAKQSKGMLRDPNARAWMVSYHADQVPMEPSQEAFAFAGTLAEDASLVERIRAVFEARPVASRQFIAEVTGISAGALTHLLPLAAFFFLDGPWLKSWVRYGVDPRTDPEARWLQIITLRLPIPIATSAEVKSSGSASYVFTGEAHSPYSSVYQICDIEYGPAKELVASAQAQPLCHKADGWFPRKTLDALRRLIKRRWLEILRETDPAGYELYLEAAKKAAVTARPKSKFMHVAKAGKEEMRRSRRGVRKVEIDPSVVEGSFAKISRLRGDYGGDDDDEEEGEEREDMMDVEDVEDVDDDVYQDEDEDEEYEFYDE